MDRHRDDAAINSEQEDLVGSSSSELDDGIDDDIISDTDGGIGGGGDDRMQFNLCNSNNKNGTRLSLADTAITDWNASTTQEYRSAYQQQQQQLQYIKKCKRTLLWLILLGFGLLIASFSLFIVLPLYEKQLEVGRRGNNAYGSILFVLPIATLIFVTIASVFGWILKWNIQIYNFPMSVRRLLIISSCCGVAGGLCVVSSFKRVPCHLQDPLKGAALVYALIFYFLFCKKVMGLQKIFSATTAIVGLFISVDYGLCDEYRCYGNDMSDSVAKLQNVGWQGHAFWTLIYVAGITLWTLHLSLLEGNLILSTCPPAEPPNNLLTTISRLVSNTDRQLEDCLIESPATPKHRPKPTHLSAWLHMIGLLVMFITGSIDMVPSTGTVKSFSQHWVDTGNTLMCHLGIEPISPALLIIHKQKLQQEQQQHQVHDVLDFLSNLTPGSLQYNETVQNIHKPRNKRCLNCGSHTKNFHRRIGHHVLQQTLYHQGHHWNRSDWHHSSNQKHTNTLSSSSISSNPNVHLAVSTFDESSEYFNCHNVMSYALLLIFVYVIFILCVMFFLDISESAVFTVTIITAALPLVELFWSTFRLNIEKATASIVWSPTVSGELICSLLGTPIVFLGLLLLYRAHFSEMIRPTMRSLAKNPYRTLQTA